MPLMPRTHVHCLHERKKGRDRERRTEGGGDEWRNSGRGGRDREYEREEDVGKEREEGGREREGNRVNGRQREGGRES